MAGGQNNYGFLKSLFLVGFSTIAIGIWKSRESIHKYGYEMHAMDMPEVDLTGIDMANINNNVPANVNESDIHAWIHANDAGKNNLRLVSSAATPTIENLEKHTKTPALIKHGADVYAYVNAPGGVQLIPIPAPQYQDLKFPNIRAGKQFGHKDIIAPQIVAALAANHAHIKASATNRHGDSHLDNRVLVIRGVEAGGAIAYESIMQDNTGNWVKHPIDLTNPAVQAAMLQAQPEFEGTAATPDAAGVARVPAAAKAVDHVTYEELTNTVVNAQDALAGNSIKSANERYNQAEKLNNMLKSQNLMTATGLFAAAPTIFSVAKALPGQALNTKMYAVMNQGKDFIGEGKKTMAQVSKALRLRK